MVGRYEYDHGGCRDISRTVYPNPVDDNLTIEAKDIKNVSVYNLTGQKVYESKVNADEVNLNMSSERISSSRNTG